MSFELFFHAYECGKPYAVQQEIDFALSLLQESAALSDRRILAIGQAIETLLEGS